MKRQSELLDCMNPKTIEAVWGNSLKIVYRIVEMKVPFFFFLFHGTLRLGRTIENKLSIFRCCCIKATYNTWWRWNEWSNRKKRWVSRCEMGVTLLRPGEEDRLSAEGEWNLGWIGESRHAEKKVCSSGTEWLLRDNTGIDQLDARTLSTSRIGAGNCRWRLVWRELTCKNGAAAVRLSFRMKIDYEYLVGS